MHDTREASGAAERYYTRLEVAEAAGVSYAQIRHWQEIGLLECEPASDAEQATPGSVQHLFPERSLRKAVHIAELRRAGISLQSIAQLLQFISEAGPQPLFLDAGDQPAMILLSPKYVEAVLGLLAECGVRGGKEVEDTQVPDAVPESEWLDHSFDGVLLKDELRRSSVVTRRLNRRDFIRVIGLSATAAAVAACAGATSIPTEPTAAPADTPAPAGTAVAEALPASKYSEAPMLAERVAAGELPPVQERLPIEPLVIPVVEEIGQYGGTWHRIAVGDPGDVRIRDRLSYECLLRWTPDADSYIPNVARDFEVNDDVTEFTFYLREGMKWSDGEPFTADDFMFWYQDGLLNKDLTPAFPRWLTDPQNGQPMTLEKVDNYTIKFSFASPYGLFLQLIASQGLDMMNWPKHYLSQFHPAYADEAELNAKVAAANFENWWELFEDRRNWQNIECPRIWAWIPTRVPPDLPIVVERNPYYWKVDPEGNQLPYIDVISHDMVESADLLNLRAVAGEIDMQLRHITWNNYPLFIENAEQGDYHLVQWVLGEGSNCTLYPNLNHQDEVLRALFQNLDFRKAISLGIHRSEIHELAYSGFGEPRQASLIPQCAYFKPEYATFYAEHDPDAANQLLDEIGLSERDEEGYRLRPDGQPMSLDIQYAPVWGPWRDAVMMIIDQWRDIGVRAVPRENAEELVVTRTNANEFDINIDVFDYCVIPLVNPVRFMPGSDGAASNAVLWWRWYQTRGREGEEPPPEIKEQYALYDQIRGAAPEDVPNLAATFFDTTFSQLWAIGTVGALPHVGVVKNNFRNVPEVAVSDYQLKTPGNTRPEQYFIEQ